VNNTTQLKWKTSNEVNSSHFEIERSSNGINFSSIEKVTAKVTGNNSYTAADPQPHIGNNFYRLKMFDKDGGFEYSSTILIKVSKEDNVEFVVYPNPAKDQLVISSSGIAGPVKGVIFNHQGQQVFSKQAMGSTAALLSIGHLPKGLYLVQLVGNSIKKESKLIKQ